MQSSNVVVHSTALTSAVSRKTLGEGSTVFVRVLKNTGGNAYTVSFAGSRFSIRSEVPLKQGEAFLAKIKLENGKILLVQQQANTQKSATNSPIGKNTNLFDQNGRVLNNALATYLANLSLVPDETSYVLLNQMKLLGMKFDSQVAKKMRAITQNSSDEKNAAETALILEKKGITATPDAISAISDGSNGSNGNNSSKQKNDENSKNNKNPKTIELIEELSESNAIIFEDETENLESNIKSAFEKYIKILTDTDVANENETAISSIGLLSLFNHSGFELKNPLFIGSWIKIPFELERFQARRNNPPEKITGFITILLNPNNKTTQRCVVKINFEEKPLIFVLFFEKNKCVKIRSNIEAQKIANIPVEKCDIEHTTDFDAETENYFFMDVSV